MRIHAERRAFPFNIPISTEHNALPMLLAQQITRMPPGLFTLIRLGKIKVGIIRRFGHIPALFDGIAHNILRIEHFRAIAERMEGIMIGHDDHRVIRYARTDIMPPADELEHERLILIGNGIGAAGRSVAPFVNQRHQHMRTLTRCMCAFRQRTAQHIANPAVLNDVRVVIGFLGPAHRI